jgi:hypothetical protein
VSPFEFGVGAVLAFGASGAPQPEPTSYTLPRSGDSVGESSRLGVSYGAGIGAELRVYEWVGLGLGALYRRDAMSGSVTRAGESSTLSLSAPALHVPLTLKVIWPRAALSPFALAGAELVMPGLASAEVAPDGALGAVATAESHTFVLFGAGAELELEALGALRPSAALSVGLRPGKSEALAERVTVLPSDAVVYDAAPSYQVTLQLGAAWFW